MKRRISSFILTLALAAIGYNCYAQDDPCACKQYPPLPLMFVNKDDGIKRILEFTYPPVSKFGILNAVNVEQDIHLIFSATAMDVLLGKINKNDGIRIFFARYSPCTESPLPAAIKPGKLILLFATERKR